MCYKNTISICHDLGFEKVMTPGPFGVNDIAESSIQLQKGLDYLEMFKDMSDQCKMSLYALQCGIHIPKCKNGKIVPVCREHCEGNGNQSIFAKLFKGQAYILLP
jgi:hypothetical protein